MMDQVGFAVQCAGMVPNVVLRHSESVILNVQKLVFGTVFRWIMLPIAMRQVPCVWVLPFTMCWGPGRHGNSMFYCVADNIVLTKKRRSASYVATHEDPEDLLYSNVNSN
jgi:hypothetical protein